MSLISNNTYPQHENGASNRPIYKPEGGIFAREPILEDLGKMLGNDLFRIPLLVMFGDHDWLNYNSSTEDIQYLKNVYGVNAKLDIICGAGHHLYIENPIGFAQSLITFETENANRSKKI